jgi:adenylate kinase family enzyme
LEATLNRALDTPKVVASIFGPSKSGKTVLAEKLIGKDNLIQISGAEVQSGDDLWKNLKLAVDCKCYFCTAP